MPLLVQVNPNPGGSATHGVCRMMLSKNRAPPFTEDSHNWRKVKVHDINGPSHGNMNAWERQSSLYLLYSKDNCEGRGMDDPENPTKALTRIKMIRDGDNCPPSMREGSRIWTASSASGDFNENMNSGGDVYMCETRE